MCTSYIDILYILIYLYVFYICEYQSNHNEFRGLVYYVIAVLSLWFLYRAYKPPPKPRKSAKQPTDSNNEHVFITRKLKQAARVKYLTTKKKQKRKELALPSRTSRQLMRPRLGCQNYPSSLVPEHRNGNQVLNRQTGKKELSSFQKAMSLRRKAFSMAQFSSNRNSIEGSTSISTESVSDCGDIDYQHAELECTQL